IGQDSATFLNPVNTNMALDLIIMSGSGGSTDTPPPPPGIPLMMGEHVCLGDRTDRQGSIFMYFNGSQSSDPNEGTGASKYMKVVAPNHPIMQGIPLDTQGRVKIFREQYPQEELHVPTGGKRNFEYRWCTQAVSNAAPCTTVSWESSAQHNYKIQASTDFSNWQTVIDDAAGADGILSRTLNLGAAPQTLFLRIGRMP